MADNIVEFPSQTQFDNAALACCPCNGDEEDLTPMIPALGFHGDQVVIEAIVCPECSAVIGVDQGHLSTEATKQ